MTRQTISFTEPNSEWLSAKLESKEFKSKSEIVNAALRRVREMESGMESLRAKLIAAENSGLSAKTPEEILREIKSKARKNGQL